jgi:septal ring-binding cell division protein DamX
MDVEMTAAEDLRMPPADEGAEIDLAALAPVETPPPAAAPPVSATEIAALVEAVVEPQPTAAAPVSAEDAPRPMRRPSDLVVAHAARAAEPASAPAVRTPAAAREVATVPAGSRGVQLGAYDSEAITREAWERLVTRYGDLLGDKSLYVERTTANARVFYRLRVAGFSDTEQTRQMCEALRARGVDCIPVTLR